MDEQTALFRYFSARDGLRVLETGELIATPPKYFNDVFECSPIIKCKDPESYAQRKIEEITTSPKFFETHRAHFPTVNTFKEFHNGIRSEPRLAEQLKAGLAETDSRTERMVQEIISA